MSTIPSGGGGKFAFLLFIPYILLNQPYDKNQGVN